MTRYGRVKCDFSSPWKLTGDLSPLSPRLVSLRPFLLLEINQVESSSSSSFSSSSSLISRSTDRTAANKCLITSFLRMSFKFFLHSSPRFHTHSVAKSLSTRVGATSSSTKSSCIDRAVSLFAKGVGIADRCADRGKTDCARSARATRPDNGSKWRRTVLAAG